MNPNTVLGLAGSLLTLSLLFEMLRRRKLRGKYAIFWGAVATMTLVVALFPGTLFWLADLIGVEVPANLLFFVASMTLMAISIQHSHELGRLEERTRRLAEDVAMLGAVLNRKEGSGTPSGRELGR